MKQKNRKMKQKLAMALSLLLIAGSTAGAMPMQVMAENDINVSEDDTFDDGNILDDTAASGEQEVDAKQAAEVSYSTDGGSTWEQDDLCNVFWEVMEKKSVEIKLLRDITLESSWYPQPLAYKDQTVTLDGNGHTIARTGDSGIIVVSQPGSKLILKNITIDGGAVWSKGSPAERQNSGISSGGNGHLFWVYDGGTFILEEGAVLKNSHLTGDSYGAVQVGNSGSAGTFVMKSGSEIRDCTAKGGAAVNIVEGGSFRMEGGKIYNNYASVYGGSGVNCYGSFSMSGGEIYGNTADNIGGGVCVMGSGEASMSGGSISGNHSKKYGGGVGIRDNGIFSMTAGSVTGNTSASYGGGVFVYEGQMTVEGNPVITGNTMNGAANNLYLLSGRKVTISGALGESADIGVTADKGVISSGWNGQMAAEKIAGAYFSSDNEELTIDKDTASGEVRLSAIDKGRITEEVKREENAPEVKVPVWPEGLEDTILEDAEKELVAKGENVVIRLVVADAESSTDESDKAAVEAELKDFTMGQYLDISLLKIIGGVSSPIHETAKKISITITVPDDLKNTDSAKKRTFAVIRVHDGTAEVLPDKDAGADTITIETDRFSTYAIVYSDTANTGGSGTDGDNDSGNEGSAEDGAGGGNSGINGTDSNSAGGSQNSNTPDGSKPSKNKGPKTGDHTPIEFYATLAMIGGLAYVLLYFADHERGMTEETKRELVSGLVKWAKQGGKIRKLAALTAIFALLVYYHSIGKRTVAKWRAAYGE